uniref:FN3 associated domain-containing protein n=1 Tax=Alloprevotella sp. TaxID=1872471 RepID=UPI0040254591
MRTKLLSLKTLLVICLMAIVGGVETWAQTTEKVDFTAQGYSNGASVTSYNKGKDFSIAFEQGTYTSVPAYYYSKRNKYLRLYAGNIMTISSSTKMISKVVFTYSGSNKPSTDTGYKLSSGSYSAQSNTWTADAKKQTQSVTFTNTHTAQYRIQTIEVTFASTSSVLPAPIISEATKIFIDPFTVSLSTKATAAEGILYTLDGTDPSLEYKAAKKYTEPIQISATTTLKAVSYATNGTTYEYSPIATATYTKQGDDPIVIWSEDWSAFKAGDKPAQGENATYVFGGEKTAVKEGENEHYAGGVTPEIMIATKGSLSITINDLKGVTNGLMFTFKTNRDESEFQVSADNATILSNEVIGDSKDTRKYIMVLNEGTTTLTIKLDNQTGKNARVDDLELSTYVGNFNITEAGYGTYYSSKAYIMPKGVKGYTITGNEGTSLVMNEAYAAGAVVPAKTALVVEGAANKYYTLVAESTELTPDDNKLHGSDEAETTYVDGTDVKYYKLSYNNEGNNLGFYWGSENGAAFANGAHKAYLALDSEKLLSQSRGFSLADLAHGVTTGINTTVKSATQSNFIYDLNGRRINSLNGAAKGVYIMNGQKVLVK